MNDGEKGSLLKSAQINTPLGPMLAMADNTALYLLEFVDKHDLTREIEKMQSTTHHPCVPGTNTLLMSIEAELNAYFEGHLKAFTVPLCPTGTPFQLSVWQSLQQIPYGDTIAYAEQSLWVGKPSATRAVANANSRNPIAIVIPCHRVINLNGALGGYAGGIDRKKWLIEHEKRHKEVTV